MGGATINLLPRESELARRAAGGDGSAFLRLYDRYAAEVFETALTAGGSVERAADATQSAFLTLLRHPPAIDAPDAELIDRLCRMALAAELDRPPATGAGVGWLRSETIAKAGARFDADWSSHLTDTDAPERTLPEVAFAWHPEGGRTPDVRPAGRKRRRLSFPIPAVRIGVPALGAAAAALALVAAGGEDTPSTERTRTLASIDAARLTPLWTIAEPREGSRKSRSARAPRSEPAATAVEMSEEPPVEVVAAQPLQVSGTGRGEAPARAPAPAETLGVTQEVGSRRAGDGLRQEAPRPPSRPPAASPSPPAAPAPAEPAPEPAPGSAPANPGSATGGVRRNCNSKRSLDPC